VDGESARLCLSFAGGHLRLDGLLPAFGDTGWRTLILPAIAMVAAMAAAVLAAARLTAEAPWPLALAVQIAAGSAVYLLLAWRLTPKVLSDLALTARGEATP
jgi:anti-sigma-K factor RskA